MVLLARNWWLLGLRGLAAVIFGLLTFFNPESSLVVLVLFFGAFALVDGIFAIVAGASAPTGNKRWGWLIVGGILGVLIGVGTFFLPLATAFALAIWIGAWAIMVGITQIVTAFRLRKEIEGEFWLMLGGGISVLFGILALINPMFGALTITLLMGLYAFVFGIIMLVVAWRLRSWGNRLAKS